MEARKEVLTRTVPGALFRRADHLASHSKFGLLETEVIQICSHSRFSKSLLNLLNITNWVALDIFRKGRR
jgi:hypothetical protein